MGRPKHKVDAPDLGAHPSLRVKIRVGDDVIGPGKVRLLELIEEHGSISAAAGVMGINYRRAWFLLESLQKCFAEPLFTTSRGGGSQGGAQLTAHGKALVRRFDTFGSEMTVSAGPFIDWIASCQAEKQRGD